jgi:hypothetical protein
MHDVTRTALTDVEARPRTGRIVQAVAVALSLAPVIAVAVWSALWAL